MKRDRHLSSSGYSHGTALGARLPPRLVIGKMGQVYAYRSELDRWMKQRQPGAEDNGANNVKESPEVQNAPDISKETPEHPTANGKSRGWKWKAAVLCLLLPARLGWVNSIHDWFHNLLFPPPKKMSRATVEVRQLVAAHHGRPPAGNPGDPFFRIL